MKTLKPVVAPQHGTWRQYFLLTYYEMEDVKTACRVTKGDVHPLAGGYPVIGKTQLGVLLKQITCAVWGGVCQHGWHVTLQQLVCSHLCWHWSRAAAMNSGSTQSIEFHLKLPDVSSAEKHFKCLIMSQYDYFKWVYVVTFHRTAVVPKLVVLRSAFTIEILELCTGGIIRHMSWFQPGLIFAVDRRGHVQDTVILYPLTWLLGAGERDYFPGRRCSVRRRDPSNIVCYNLAFFCMNHFLYSVIGIVAI